MFEDTLQREERDLEFDRGIFEVSLDVPLFLCISLVFHLFKSES